MYFNHPPPPPSQLPSVCLPYPIFLPTSLLEFLYSVGALSPLTGSRETHGMGSKGPLPPEIKRLLLRVYDSGG